MLEKNWVKNYRKIEEWRYYKKPEYAHLWQHLIRKARFKDCYNSNGQLVKRGQVDFSIRQLENETGVSMGTVRNILKKLEMNTEICTVHHGRNNRDLSIISIVNYEKYQEPLRSDTQQIEQLVNTSDTVDEQQLHNSKKEKNEKNEKNNNTLSEKPTKPPRKSDIDQKAKEVAQLWNAMAEVSGLPCVKLPLSAKRRDAIKKAFRDMGSYDEWVQAVKQVPCSDFRLGANDREWRANFDWFLRSTNQNYLKMLEEANVKPINLEGEK